MAKRGRPRSARAASAKVVHVKIRLYKGEDDDLIRFFAQIPKGLAAASVKRALREGAQIASEPTEDDGILHALSSLVEGDGILLG